MNTDKFNELLIRVNPCFSVVLLVRVFPWSDVAGNRRSAAGSVAPFGRGPAMAARSRVPRRKTTTDGHGSRQPRMNTDEHGQFNELLIRVHPCYSVALLVRVVPW